MNKYFFKNRFCYGSVNGSFIHQANQLCQIFGAESNILRILFLLFQKAHSLHHKPVGCLLWSSAESRCLLEYIRHMLGGSKNLRVIFRNLKLLFISLHFFRLQFRLAAADSLNPLMAYDYGHQIRIWKISVVLSVFLGAHSIGTLLVVIPPSCLLDYLFPLLDPFNLSLSLPFNGSGYGFK